MNISAIFDDLGFSLPDVMMLVAIVLLTLLLLSTLRRRGSRRGGAQRMDPQEKEQHMREVSGMRSDVREMMVELEELARRFSAQLDAKSMRLEKLIEEADRKSERLEQLTRQMPDGDGRCEGHSESVPHHEAPQMHAASSPAAREQPMDPMTRRVCDMADEGRAPLEIARELDEQVGKVELILALRQT